MPFFIYLLHNKQKTNIMKTLNTIAKYSIGIGTAGLLIVLLYLTACFIADADFGKGKADDYTYSLVTTGENVDLLIHNDFTGKMVSFDIDAYYKDGYVYDVFQKKRNNGTFVILDTRNIHKDYLEFWFNDQHIGLVSDEEFILMSDKKRIAKLKE